MTAGRIIFPGFMPAEDGNGVRIAGARAYFYLDGTTTPTTVYAENDLTGPFGPFVEADSVGVWPPMWADTALYFNVALTDGAGVPLPDAAWSHMGPAIDATLASVALVETAADEAAASAADAAASAVVAAEAAAGGYVLSATSASNVLIGVGAKVFALDQVTDISVGMDVYAARSSDVTQRMLGRVTAYAHPLLTISVPVGGTSGAGAYANWTIGPAQAFDGNTYAVAARLVSAAGLATGGGDLSADRTITVTAALAADVRGATNTSKAVTAGALADSAAYITLADAATVVWDYHDGYNAQVVLGGNRLIGQPSNLYDGCVVTLDVVQDATGSRLPSWHAIWDFGAAGTPVASTGANKRDQLVGQYHAASGKIKAAYRKAA